MTRPDADAENDQAQPAARITNGSIVQVVLVYAVVAALWILGSDWLLQALLPEGALRTQVALAKGWAFVFITSLLIYSLMRRAARPPARQDEPADGATSAPSLRPVLVPWDPLESTCRHASLSIL